MTVKELTDKLWQLDGETQVFISDTDKAYGEGTKIKGIYKHIDTNDIVIVCEAEL